MFDYRAFSTFSLKGIYAVLSLERTLSPEMVGRTGRQITIAAKSLFALRRDDIFHHP
jgi:hypothetical protein